MSRELVSAAWASCMDSIRGRAGRWALVAMCSAVGAACSTVPAPRFHTLLAAESPSPAVPALQGLTLWVEPVRVPSQVDQPQWLVRLEDETLVLLEQERWASPLRDELQQALREVLTRRFGAVDVGTSGAGPATLRLLVEITRFELRSGEAWLDSTWLLGPAAPERARLRCVTSLREAAGPGMPALAQAQRRAVMRLGTAIGEQLAALQRGEAGRCPV